MANQCKYTKEVLQVSYDSGVTWVNIGETRKGDLYEYNSAECGAVTQYRWVDVTGAYTCEGTTKYQKTKKQYSTDGTTWQDVSPAEYGKGQVVEYHSTDCGRYSKQYLTFVALEDGRFKFSGGAETGNDHISYSMDGGNRWTTLASDNYSPTVSAGQKIMWKGELVTTSRFSIGKFSSTNTFEVEGNPMSLLFGDNFEGQTSLANMSHAFGRLFYDCTTLSSVNNLKLVATSLSFQCYSEMFGNCTSLTSVPRDLLPATTLAQNCYVGMFKGCTSLTTVPSDLLPATTLANMCYSSMFSGCTSLTTAPELPATTLAEGCYGGMFQNCTSLTTAPELPATTLAQNCYLDMFSDCTSLTTAPELPATTLAQSCYYTMFEGCTSLTTAPSVLPATTLVDSCYCYMFEGCTSLMTAPELPAITLVDWCYFCMFEGCSRLNYIKCLATNISAYACTVSWVQNVSSSGTFVKASSMSSWTRGTNGIPTNWTVQNA